MNSLWIPRLLLFTLLWGNHPLISQEHFTVTPAYTNLYHQAWECEKPKSEDYVHGLTTADPENLLIYHFLNYFDFITLLTNDNLEGADAFNELVDERLDRIKSGPRDSPYYYFSQAELYVQRSIIKSKKEQFVRAGWDINKAHKLLRTCQEQFPDFKLASKSLSVIHTIAGSVKGFKRTMMQLLTSLDGTIPEGLEEIEHLYAWNLDHPTLWSDEIIVIRAMIAGHIEQDWDEAFTVMNHLSIQKRHTPLGLYLLSWTAAKAGKNETVLQLLSSEEGLNQVLPVFDYLYGKALLQAMDVKAKDFLLTFIEKHPEGEYARAACLRMAWYSLIFENNIRDYHNWMDRILKFGSTRNIQDRQALEAAESGIIPNAHLLKSRILFDGGYYEEALGACHHVNKSELSQDERIELVYRRARIHQELKEFDTAKLFFREVISREDAQRTYYACNAALQMAQIFYNEGAYQQAQHYANLSLSMNPKEQKKSLHSEARIIKDLTAGF